MAEKIEVEVLEKKASTPIGRKKKIILISFVIVALLLASAVGIFIRQRSFNEVESSSSMHNEIKGPPSFLPLDNMVVNLSNSGGEKVVQLGIVLELSDSKAVDKIKIYLPSIRSGILLLISQKTADEILKIEGKEKLAADILIEANKPLSIDFEKKDTSSEAIGDGEIKKNPAAGEANDKKVRAVHFSSFIVQ